MIACHHCQLLPTASHCHPLPLRCPPVRHACAAPMLDALATGLREVRSKPVVGELLAMDAFLQNMLRSRITRRVLAEQHINIVNTRHAWGCVGGEGEGEGKHSSDTAQACGAGQLRVANTVG